MIRFYENGFYVFDGNTAVSAQEAELANSPYRDENGRPLTEDARAAASRRTITYQILRRHMAKNEKNDGPLLRLRFDCLTSHDITYVGIIQTIRASMKDYDRFPLPYVLSNCHNSLCAVGGTINADDHAFGLSAAQKYGGIFVPPHFAVIHQYMRERMAGCGRMILGSDSHTRYGALGAMGIGEGGGELVKQLLGRTYDIPCPEVVGIQLTGTPRPGVGPQDVALALIGRVFNEGLVKNKVLEFFGEGVTRLSMDFRNGIDVMTTETACLSSVWATDDTVKAYLEAHGRGEDYAPLRPGQAAYYNSLIEIDLSAVKPMIALPFHPSNAFEIDELNKNAADYAGGFPLRGKLHNGRLRFDQGIIAGCAGGLYENITEAAGILGDGSAFPLTVYPASQPVYLALTENGVAAQLMRAGAVFKTAFCGPCFGAGDVPANEGLSARHATRNFPNREGSKPGSGQSAAVALMDARSIAATVKNGGILTAAGEADYTERKKQIQAGINIPYRYDPSVYEKRVYNGWGRPNTAAELVLGPGIRDWPPMGALDDNLLLTVAAFITDPVTTTDELIPSGETSSYRSNPLALSEFTLSRKDPGYVARAKAAAETERRRQIETNKNETGPASENEWAGDDPAWTHALAVCRQNFGMDISRTGLGSLVYAIKPGDGSAREQAASCQRVLGGRANIAREYATKRYRSNLVNWGLAPFILPEEPPFALNDRIFIPGLRQAVEECRPEITAYVVRDTPVPFTLRLPGLTEDEAAVLRHGGLINYYGGGN